MRGSRWEDEEDGNEDDDEDDDDEDEDDEEDDDPDNMAATWAGVSEADMVSGAVEGERSLGEEKEEEDDVPP